MGTFLIRFASLDVLIHCNNIHFNIQIKISYQGGENLNDCANGVEAA